MEPLAMVLERLAGIGIPERDGNVLPTKQHLAAQGDGADSSEGIVGEGLDGVAHNKAPVLRAK